MTTQKSIKKFFREEGGVGPECYPGEPGGFSKQWCLDRAQLQYTELLNKAYGDDTSTLSSDGLIPADALYGNEFEEYPGNTVPTTGTYDVVTQFTSKRAFFKRGYNEQYAQNLTNRPPGVLKMDDIVEHAIAKHSAIDSIARKFDYFQEFIAPCFCEEYAEDTLVRFNTTGASSDNNDEEKDPEKDPEKDVEENLIVSANGAENISEESTAIPHVFGRQIVRCNLIERRADMAVFGVCLAKENMSVSRIYFGDTLVFANGGVVDQTAVSSISLLQKGNKDLITITLFDADITQITTKYAGLVRAEVIDNSVTTGTVVDTHPATLLVSDISTGTHLSIDALNGDVLNSLGAAIPQSYPANAHLKKPGAVIVGTNVYIEDKIVDLYSGSVDTIVPILTAPIGVHKISEQRAYLITNDKVYTTDSGDYHGLQGPNPSALFYATNRGISADGRTLFLVDGASRKHVKHPLPAATYDTYLFNDAFIALINSSTGDIQVIKGVLPHLQVNMGAALVPAVSGGVDSSNVLTFVTTSGNVLYFSMVTGDVFDADVNIPVTYTRLTVVGNKFIGETASGDVVTTITTTTGATTIDAMVREASDKLWKGIAAPLTGHLFSDPNRSYLDYLLQDVATAYDLYAENIGGIGNLIPANSFASAELELTQSTAHKTVTQAAADSSDSAIESVGATFTFLDAGYEVVSLDVALPLGVDNVPDFKTTALLDAPTASERAIKYVERRTSNTTTVDTPAASTRNIIHTVGLNFDQITWSPEISDFSHVPEKLGGNTPTHVAIPIIPTPFVPSAVLTYSLPRTENSFRGVPRMTQCAAGDGLLVGRALTQLPTTHSYRLEQHPDVFLDIAFLVPPVGVPGTVSYEALLADDKLNLICLGGKEWIQYQTVTTLSPTVIRLSGLMRGRFATTGQEAAAAPDTTVVFYSAAKCVDRYAKGISLPPYPNVFVTDIVHYFQPSGTYRFHISEVKYWLRRKAAGTLVDIRDVYDDLYWAETPRLYTKLRRKVSYSKIPDHNAQVVAAVNDPDPTDGAVQEFLLNRGTNSGDYWYVGYRQHTGTGVEYTSLKDFGEVEATASVAGDIFYSQIVPYKKVTVYRTSLVSSTTSTALVITPEFNPYTEELDIALRHV